MSDEHTAADISALASDIATMRAIEAKRKTLDEIYKQCRARVEAALISAAATDGVIEGRTVVTWRARTSNRLNQSKLKENFPEAAAACMAQSTSRYWDLITPKAEPESDGV